MASLAQFAVRIRAMAGRIERNFDTTLRRTALAVSQTVVMSTPVDTGRARANWQVSLGQPVQESLDATDPGGGPTMAKNANVINQARGDAVIYLSNNLDYIVSLNQGSSSQAPAGFVEDAVAQGASVVRRSRLVTR